MNLDGREGGEEFGGAERGKSVIRLYCVRKEFTFIKNGGKKVTVSGLYMFVESIDLVFKD